MTAEQIIEREFRKALRLDPSEVVMVELDKDAEEIRIFSRCQVLTCDCTGDDFVFIDQRGNEIIFAVPEDYLRLVD